ncbi:hypothetical protein BU25DRAFT_243840 [Macroventuria anomochaeta]|uniref:Uncharacterized protein n=1 Tax=Macroventuria anomochaeta TaxID=301207 RepID=A0ACB6SAJ2_9PLEO|nr:uncharacterized protein BU25DRAFT_243840 [Macroventuria anomochaeta]KAF2630610.1 hypothetical protein BU25DRAFT_243840 [Macroventuria anomochaeta]
MHARASPILLIWAANRTRNVSLFPSTQGTLELLAWSCKCAGCGGVHQPSRERKARAQGMIPRIHPAHLLVTEPLKGVWKNFVMTSRYFAQIRGCDTMRSETHLDAADAERRTVLVSFRLGGSKTRGSRIAARGHNPSVHTSSFNHPDVGIRQGGMRNKGGNIVVKVVPAYYG